MEHQLHEKLTYSVSDLVKILGVSRGMAYKIVNDPQGPQVMRVGARILVPKVALERWIDEQTQKAS